MFRKADNKSEHLKEVIYGEEFFKLRVSENFYYGYSTYDNYFGYIKKKDFKKFTVNPIKAKNIPNFSALKICIGFVISCSVSTLGDWFEFFKLVYE